MEIHVPLRATPGLASNAYPFPWIEDVEAFLVDVEDRGEAEVYDDGEEYGEVYVFFVTGADEDSLLAVASRAAKLDRVPTGAFAMVTHDEADEFGQGRRVDLPLP